MNEHEMRDDCSRRVTKLEGFQERVERQPDGIIATQDKENTERIRRVHERVDQKVSLKLMIWLFALIVGFIGGSYGYTTSIAKEHEDLATKQEMQKVEDKVEMIREIQVEVVTTLKNINNSLNEIKQSQKEIKKAVKNNE